MRIGKVVSNIPIPPPKHAFRAKGESIYPFRHMKVGESFSVCPDKGEDTEVVIKRVRSAIFKVQTETKLRFSARSNETCVRIWRVK